MVAVHDDGSSDLNLKVIIFFSLLRTWWSSGSFCEGRSVLGSGKGNSAAAVQRRLAGPQDSTTCTAPLWRRGIFCLALKIGPCDVNASITGEKGTGKELLARAIHQTSLRAAVVCRTSCANLPDTLIEDELFGHERGAFTGAIAMRRGRIENADQGSLFLG